MARSTGVGSKPLKKSLSGSFWFLNAQGIHIFRSVDACFIDNLIKDEERKNFNYLLVTEVLELDPNNSYAKKLQEKLSQGKEVR